VAELPDKRDVERALREAGLSARQATRLLSGGWRALAPDDPLDAEALLIRLEALVAASDRTRQG
jgi:hypothetical protein